VNAAVEDQQNKEQYQEYQKASPPRESKDYILTPTPIRVQRAGQPSTGSPQQVGFSTAWDFGNSSPLSQVNIPNSQIYTDGNQSHSPAAHSFPGNGRTPIPQLYQHQPRSAVTQQHQFSPQPEISSAIHDSVSSEEKTSSNQNHKVAALTHEKNYDDASDSVQERLTAFASSPIRKFPSASTVSSRHIEKDRLTCIHSLGILDGVNRKLESTFFFDFTAFLTNVNRCSAE
jgi:hypothetical protein